MATRSRHHTSAEPERRTAIAGIVLSSLLLLLISLGTSALLLFVALERAQIGILSERFELAGREAATRIEAGLRFGRPLDQFLNLDTILAEIRAETEGVEAALVFGAGAVPIADGAREDTAEIGAALSQALALGDAVFVSGDVRLFATPLRAAGAEVVGHLLLAVPQAALSEQVDTAIHGAVVALLVVTGIAVALLAVAAGRMRGAMAQRQISRWRWMTFPVLVLLSAQVAYSLFALQVYRDNFQAATITAAESVGGRIQGDLERLLRLGLTFERMPGLEAQLGTILNISGAVERVELFDATGTLRFGVAAETAEIGWFAELFPLADIAPLRLSLTGAGDAPAGAAVVHVAAGSIQAGIAAQSINILTVAATSVFFMIELMILLQILFRRSAARAREAAVHGRNATAGTATAGVTGAVVGGRETAAGAGEATPDPTGGEPMHLLARPVIFGFVFAWALPLSFLPLKMRGFGGELLGLPADVVLALPISVEMGCALITAVIAGRLADSWGWYRPFVAGLLLSALGGVLAAMAPDGATFVAARGLTGLGYGLSWMGLQAFVIQKCPEERRGQALSNLMAGILAGFIAGTAVGGILAEQFGFDPVLLATGILAIVPLIVARIVLGDYLHLPPRAAQDPVQPAVSGQPVTAAPSPRAGWGRLFRSPEYMGVLLFSVVPFSIAQVGLLYFAVPLYLNMIGASASDAGRILMVYGVVVILLGPQLSRLIDRSRAKLAIVVFGGLIGGAGLLALLVDLGLGGILLAATLLSLSSALIEPARAAFVLRLPVVREVGLASAFGLQRAADKFGQMIGPLVIALSFGASEIVQRVAFVGMGFILASLMLAALILLRRATGQAASVPR